MDKQVDHDGEGRGQVGVGEGEWEVCFLPRGLN